MILDESQVEKTSTETGELWTTPWRYSRVEAYTDLIDIQDYVHAYTLEKSFTSESILEDDDDNSRHRARCSLTPAPSPALEQ